MEFREVIARRYSCRKYDSRPVEREKIVACLEAGRISPSSCNSQRWLFVAVDDKRLLGKLAAMLNDPEMGLNRFSGEIPAFIVIVRHPPRRLNAKQERILSRVDHSLLDIGIAAHQICLAATDQGLGSIMLGWFDQQEVRDALGIPPELDIPLIIGLGYPASDSPRGPGRHLLEEVMRWNGFTKAGAQPGGPEK